MKNTQIVARIQEPVRKAMAHYCKESGTKIARFIELAIIEKLESLEDVRDIRKAKNDSVRSFESFVRELKLGENV